MVRLTFPIWAKIGAAFATMFLVVLLVGGLALQRAAAIDAQTMATRDDWLPSAQTLGQLRTSLRQYRIAEATLGMSRDGGEAVLALANLRAAAAAIDNARRACSPYITGKTEDVRYMNDFDQAWQGYQAASERVARSFLPPRGVDRSLYADSGRLYEAAAAALTSNIAFNAQAGRDSADAAVRLLRQTRSGIVTSLLVAVGACVLLGLMLTRSVSIPIKAMTSFMRRLAAHELKVPTPGVDRRDELGAMATAVEVFRDSLIETDRLRAEERAERALLAESELRFRAVFDSVNDGSFVVDAETALLLAVNQRGCDLFGFERDELIGSPIVRLSSGQPPYTEENALQQIAIGQREGPHILEWSCRAKHGRVFWVEISVRRARLRDRPVIMATVRDTSDRRAAEAQIQHMARHDGLTGLPNRGVFVEAVQRESARARREGGLFAVFFLDLDHFKDVNDTLGHPVGDELLRSVARRLRSAVRESDIVARSGGDEFAVLATGLRDSADAAALGDTLLRSLRDPLVIDGKPISSGCSVGIALYDSNTPEVDSMMSHADVALYQAKSAGRGTCRVFTDAIGAEMRARVTLLEELREAIASDELFLVYQPQVEIVSGRITGLEALVRWRHPRLGVITPGAFIHETENAGLIMAVGQRVLRQAIRQARAWDRAGILPASIAINLSAAELKMLREFEGLVTGALAESGLSPGRLEIELTESILMSAGDHREVLARLRASRIRLAIDDFGTGYSCLDYLCRLPADRVKIAESFVANAERAGDAAVIKATIGLARELGMGVIAEGIESARQRELLLDWGCSEGQGFYYSQPLTAETIEPLLRTGIIPVAPVCAEAA